MEHEIVDYGLTIAEVASAIEGGRLDDARGLASSMPARTKRKKIEGAKYAAVSKEEKGAVRKYTLGDLMEVFRRDGFVDRYTVSAW